MANKSSLSEKTNTFGKFKPSITLILSGQVSPNGLKKSEKLIKKKKSDENEADILLLRPSSEKNEKAAASSIREDECIPFYHH